MSVRDPRARAAEIVSELTQAEKIALVSGSDMWHLESIEAAGIPPLMLTDGPNGLRKQRTESTGVDLGASVPATCFPPSATLAASWDPGLAEEVGRAIGEEARAEGVAVVLGPGLNLKRHPACGRNFEYFSEDPLLSGLMAASVARGIQSTGVGACLKHFALNNQERNRMTVDVIVDERTERELYLRGFEIAVARSRPWAVMCAYNRVNGEYCSDSRRLLTTILRDEWDFDGLVVSDWGATNDRVKALEAGLDLEMPTSHGVNDAPLARAIEQGGLEPAILDTAARRVVELMLRALPAVSAGGTYDAAQHHELARRAAAESTVLLTNDGILPLAPSGRVAIIGRFAEQPRYQGAGSSQIVPTMTDCLLDEVRARIGPEHVTYVPGYELPAAPVDELALEDARQAAAGADVAIVMVGLPEAYESEAFDREDLCIPAQHARLVEAVCEANRRTVVVVSNGAPVELPWADLPAALVEAYLGGQASGSALADVLFGDRDPGGRLPETFPVEQTDILSDSNFPGSPRQVQYRENLFVGYRQFATTGQHVRFPFGHGLSYTSFAIDDVELSVATARPDENVTATVHVRNTGDRAGSTVIQLYTRPMPNVANRPGQELVAFSKLKLAPGEQMHVELQLDPHAFAVWDVGGGAWKRVGGRYEVLAGFSANDICATADIEIDSDFTLPSDPAAPVLDASDEQFERLLGRPIPHAEPVRPFTRTSTVTEIGQTALGRRIQKTLRSSFLKQLGAEGDLDPALEAMLDSVVMQLPLRSLVTMAGGRLGWRQLDAIIEALNGHWLAAARTLVRGGGA